MINLHDEINNIDYPFREEIIDNSFTYIYSQTTHSSQGLTINDKYTIYESLFYYTSLAWFWVAITRTTNIDNIYINLCNYENIKKIQ